MGRRSDFPRIPRDAYPTPAKAVLPLLPYLAPVTRFIEPCAGNAALVQHLEEQGHVCRGAFDIAPTSPLVTERNALMLTSADLGDATCMITNFPWSRDTLHALIDHLRRLLPVWTIIEAAWAHTKQAAEYMRFCSHIVSIGRVKWIDGSDHTGKDDAAWYRFQEHSCETIFCGRQPC